MKMKRVLCGVLAAIICLSLFGCGKNDKVEPDAPKDETVNNVDVPTYVPEESPVAAEPQYESAHMSVQTFEDNFAYENDANRTIIDAINGNILDVYVDQEFYTLTNNGVYQCSWMFDSSALNIDPGDNTKIHFVGYQNVVLSDDNGKITIFYHPYDVADGVYYSYTDDNMIIDTDDILLVSHNLVSFEEDVIIIKDISKNGIVATVVESIWADDDTLEMKTTAVDKLFPFSEELKSEIKEIYFADTNDTRGTIVLENGNLYYFYLSFDSGYGETDASVSLKKIDVDVDRVVYLNSSDYIRYTKLSDDRYVYHYDTMLSEDSSTWIPTSAQGKIADGYKTTDIVEVRANDGFVKFTDGTWYNVSHHSVSYDYEMGLSLKDFETKYKDAIDFGFIPVVCEGKVVEFLANNWSTVNDDDIQRLDSSKKITANWILMDDGYIYEYIYE